MAINIDEKYIQKVNSIMSKLPQTPFIIDVIGKTIEISYENYADKDNYGAVLDLALKATEYVSEHSSATSYKYSLIASVLLAGLDAAKYEVIDTASGTVKDYVEAITAFAFNKGWKDAWLQLNNLVKKDSDLLYIAFLIMVANLEDILAKPKLSITDKYCLAGMAYIEVSLRKSAITIPNRQYELYNKFMSLMMKKADF